MTTFDIIPPSIIDAKGDLIVGLANDTPTRLGAGAAGQVLTVASDGSLVWSTPSGGSGSLPSGGSAGQALIKASATNGDATWIDLKRDASFYLPGSLIVGAVPAKFIVPAPGLRVTDLLATVGTAGAGGDAIVKVLAGAAEIGTITLTNGTVAASTTLTATTIASGTTISLAVTSVPSTAPKDLSVSLWWT